MNCQSNHEYNRHTGQRGYAYHVYSVPANATTIRGNLIWGSALCDGGILITSYAPRVVENNTVYGLRANAGGIVVYKDGP